MHADEAVGRQVLLDGLHVHQRQDAGGGVLGVDFHIVFESLDVENLRHVDLDEFVLALDDDVLVVGCRLWLRRGLSTGLKLRPLQRAVGCGEKLRIVYGFQQVVNGIVAESVERIFLESGDKDDAAFRRNDFRKLYAVELRHLNVEKKQVYLLLHYAFYCLRGGCERCLKRQKRCLFNKRAYQPACERFVVDDAAFQSDVHKRCLLVFCCVKCYR